MPRIHAASVAEHVAQQEAAVFAAAIGLFCEHGYEQVSLGDIAAKVGLARNSLYRYFPDKAHILLRWFQTELPRQVERSASLLDGAGPAPRRIERWVIDQLDYAQLPEHRLLAALADAAPELDDAERAELAASHQQLFAPLDAALADAGLRRDADRRAVIALLEGLIMAAANHEATAGPDRVVRRHLLDAVRGLLPKEKT